MYIAIYSYTAKILAYMHDVFMDPIFHTRLQPDDENVCSADDEDSDQRCALCGDKEGQKYRYRTWGEIECTYLMKHLGKPLNDTSMVCRRHLLEAKQYHHKPDHVPSWKMEEAVSDLGPSPISFSPAKVCTVVIPSVRIQLIKPMFTTYQISRATCI